MSTQNCPYFSNILLRTVPSYAHIRVLYVQLVNFLCDKDRRGGDGCVEIAMRHGDPRTARSSRSVWDAAAS